MLQSGLTLITPILPDKVEELKALLNAIGNDIKNNPHIDFTKLRTVHFLRFVVMDAAVAKGKSIPPQLVLSTNYDGPEKAHLLELGTEARQGLNEIYRHCIGFPETASPEQIAEYLAQHKQKNHAFYVGTLGRSVLQVSREEALFHAIQEYLQQSNPAQRWEGKSATELRADIQEHIFSQEAFDWAKEPYQHSFLQRFGTAVLAGEIILIFVLFGILWSLSWPTMFIFTWIVVLLVAAFWKRLRKLEKQDAAAFRPAIKSVDQVARFNLREDFKVQNQVTHLAEIKPGLIRQIALRFVLWAINLLAGVFFNKGELAGIVTIHFARWAIIDGGKRLLFFSNYDGSWESYLGEFVDRAAIGLTGVWSNTVGFPPTRNLVQEGAKNSVEFKSWAREKQIETQIWYSARTTLSVKNINNNTAIRQGLIGTMSEEQAREWLNRL